MRNLLKIGAIALIILVTALSTTASAAQPTYSFRDGTSVRIRGERLTIGGNEQAAKFVMYDGSSNYITQVIPSLSANWQFTWPTTDGSPGQVLKTDGSGVASWTSAVGSVLYEGLTASASHAGTTAAETAVMPATDEGTGDTDLAAWLLTGAELDWYVCVPMTGDADGDETLTVKVYFGSTLVGTSGAVADDGPDEIKLTGKVKIRAGGATGTAFYSYEAFHNAAFLAMDMAAIGSTDFTAVTPFTIKLDWGGTTDAADTATVQDAGLTVVNFD